MAQKLPTQTRVHLSDYTWDRKESLWADEVGSDDVADLMFAIEDGCFDSFIVQLTRTLFKRKDALSGTDSFPDSGLRAKMTAKQPIKVTQQPPVPAFHQNTGTHIVATGRVAPVTTVIPRTHQLMWKGQMYDKRDFIGIEAQIVDPRPRSKLTGGKVRITRITGGKAPKFEVHWIDPYPRLANGRKTRIGEVADQGGPVRYSIGFFAHLFG